MPQSYEPRSLSAQISLWGFNQEIKGRYDCDRLDNADYTID
ncbi:hypothetical protein [Nostoc sp. NOS(2021)]|nr:hypothetical protein [Nostoc sp. NOS(2021)]